MNTNTLPSKNCWWQRESLRYQDGRLTFCRRDVADLAQAFDQPLFLYDADRPLEKFRQLEAALRRHDIAPRLYYAMKANRFAPLLCHLRAHGAYGIDVCSPEELRYALSCGFSPRQLSYTSHGLSPGEATLLAAFPEVMVNCDTLSAIRLLGASGRRGDIGLRINPGIGIGYGNSDKLSYAGSRTTKFGIYEEQFDDALALANRHGLRVTRLHCHAGCGYLNPQLNAYEEILKALAAFAARLPDLSEVNLGGGIGLPHREGETALDLDAWAGAIGRHIARPSITVALEPGDFIVKDSGILVLRVVYVETKRTTRFIGLDGGFNLAVEPAFYDLPCEPAPCVLRDDPHERVTLAGNINEALDIWAADVLLPPVREGDFLALINAGGYASSMSSNHCMRGQFREMLLC